MLKIEALKKWTLITVFCGAHSFFWGYMAKGNVAAMLLGMFTLILFFTFVESSAFYQSKRSGNALFAKAMDKGIRFRIYVAAYIPIFFAVQTVLRISGGSPVFFIFMAPYMAELWIGMIANWLCHLTTGIAVDDTAINYMAVPKASGDVYHNTNLEQFFATYFTTIYTGLLHTLVLGIMCGIVYIFYRMKSKRTSLPVSEQ